MAFDYTNLYPDTSANGGYTKSWNYTTVTDSIATCSASGYFNKVATRLGIGDNIVIARVDAFESRTRTTLVEFADLFVSGISAGVVTTTLSTTGFATTVYVDAADAVVAANAAAATALKANIASPTFTGVPAAPTATPGTNTTQLATTAYADAIAALKANLASPTFTGTLNSANQVITSASASTLVAGPAGATNPVLKVDASTASAATGISVKGAAAAGGVALSAISSGTNENLTVDAKGSGTLTLNGTATGNLVTPRIATFHECNGVIKQFYGRRSCYGRSWCRWCDLLLRA
jgi:hypothetical protein